MKALLVDYRFIMWSLKIIKSALQNLSSDAVLLSNTLLFSISTASCECFCQAAVFWGKTVTTVFNGYNCLLNWSKNASRLTPSSSSTAVTSDEWRRHTRGMCPGAGSNNSERTQRRRAKPPPHGRFRWASHESDSSAHGCHVPLGRMLGPEREGSVKSIQTARLKIETPSWRKRFRPCPKTVDSPAPSRGGDAAPG